MVQAVDRSLPTNSRAAGPVLRPLIRAGRSSLSQTLRVTDDDFINIMRSAARDSDLLHVDPLVSNFADSFSHAITAASQPGIEQNGSPASVMVPIGLCSSKNISSGLLPYDFMRMLTAAVRHGKAGGIKRTTVLVADSAAYTNHRGDKSRAEIDTAAQKIISAVENIVIGLGIQPYVDIIRSSEFSSGEQFASIRQKAFEAVTANDQFSSALPPGPTRDYVLDQLAITEYLRVNRNVRLKVSWAVKPLETTHNGVTDEIFFDDWYKKLVVEPCGRTHPGLPAVYCLQGASLDSNSKVVPPYLLTDGALDKRLHLGMGREAIISKLSDPNTQVHEDILRGFRDRTLALTRAVVSTFKVILASQPTDPNAQVAELITGLASGKLNTAGKASILFRTQLQQATGGNGGK